MYFLSFLILVLPSSAYPFQTSNFSNACDSCLKAKEGASCTEGDVSGGKCPRCKVKKLPCSFATDLSKHTETLDSLFQTFQGVPFCRFLLLLIIFRLLNLSPFSNQRKVQKLSAGPRVGETGCGYPGYRQTFLTYFTWTFAIPCHIYLLYVILDRFCGQS